MNRARQGQTWSYTKGSFYVTGDGTGIFYIEKNPCGCCPKSYLVEKTLDGYGNEKKKVSFSCDKDSVDYIIENRKLVELK
jgi:hypothetical protein